MTCILLFYLYILPTFILFPKLVPWHFAEYTHFHLKTPILWLLRHSSQSPSQFQVIVLNNPSVQTWCSHLHLATFFGSHLLPILQSGFWHKMRIGLVLASLATSIHPYSSLFSSLYLCLAPFLGSLIVLQFQYWSSIFGKSTLLDSSQLFWWICNLLSCVVNLISESATQREDCCIIESDQFLSLEVVLRHRVVSNHKKRVSTMARGRNRHKKSKNCDDESVPTQTGQEEEIAFPSPSPCTGPRRGILEEKEGMNERDLSQKTPQRCTSPQRGAPDATDGIYPADTSRKYADSTIRDHSSWSHCK